MTQSNTLGGVTLAPARNPLIDSAFWPVLPFTGPTPNNQEMVADKRMKLPHV